MQQRKQLFSPLQAFYNIRLQAIDWEASVLVNDNQGSEITHTSIELVVGKD